MVARIFRSYLHVIELSFLFPISLCPAFWDYSSASSSSLSFFHWGQVFYGSAHLLGFKCQGIFFIYKDFNWYPPTTSCLHFMDVILTLISLRKLLSGVNSLSVKVILVAVTGKAHPRVSGLTQWRFIPHSFEAQPRRPFYPTHLGIWFDRSWHRTLPPSSGSCFSIYRLEGWSWES